MELQTQLTTQITADLTRLSQETFPKSVFRTYDIRGKVELELTPGFAYVVGRGFSQWLKEHSEALASPADFESDKSVVVGYDGRHSSPDLAHAICLGLLHEGLQPINLGLVPTGALYFGTHTLSNHGIMVTGSHNPPEYNGIKLVADKQALFGGAIQELFSTSLAALEQIQSAEGMKDLHKNLALYSDESFPQRDILTDYEQTLIEKSGLIQLVKDNAWDSTISNDQSIDKNPLKIVIDAGNGAAGPLAKSVFQSLQNLLSIELIPLYCEVDGNFPNHHPDPAKDKNLADLQERVIKENAILGLAFDGDGDRLGVVNQQGEIVRADRLLMAFAKDILDSKRVSRTRPILYDVKCSQLIPKLIADNNGQGFMTATGHSIMKHEMKVHQGSFAGELSGHFIFADQWFGFDCGIYGALRWLELSLRQPNTLQEIERLYPTPLSTPEIQIPIEETDKLAVLQQLLVRANTLSGFKLHTIDGVRLETDSGWLLIRGSNTTPCLTLRFEAESDSQMANLKTTAKQLLIDLVNTESHL